MSEEFEVVSDAEIMGGDPCIEGTRIAVETIIANLKAGISPEQISAAYPTLPEGAVITAIRWAEARGIGWRGVSEDEGAYTNGPRY